MIISAGGLRAHLDNVLWIGGAACGGKTTMVDLLAEKHGFVAYHSEDFYARHKDLANKRDHPNILAPIADWSQHFTRPVDEYVSSIVDADRERFEMIVVDLIKLCDEKTVIADCHALSPVIAESIIARDKAVFLFAESEVIRKVNFTREGTQDLLALIETLENPEQIREHVLDVVCETSARKLAQVRASDFSHYVRDERSTVEEVLVFVEECFGLG